MKDISELDFEVNPCDPCIANRMSDGEQHTITWHVDDTKSSHMDPEVNDEFEKWCEKRREKWYEKSHEKRHEFSFLDTFARIDPRKWS